MSSTDITQGVETCVCNVDPEAESASIENNPQSESLSPVNEPSTSTGFKTQFTVNIGIKPSESFGFIKKDEPLGSLDDLALKLTQKETIEDDESFVTVQGCPQDNVTSTQPIVVFNNNARRNEIVTRNTRQNQSYNQPPPPYDYNQYESRGRLGQTPVYQEQYVVYMQDPYVPQDASRAPPYQRNYNLPEELLNAFLNKEIRNRFVQRVYMILSLQLLITFGLIFFCIYNKNVNNFVKHDIVLLIVSGIMYFIVLIALFCCEQTRRIFPLNFILLFLLTLAMAYMTAFISCFYDTYIVLVTFGVTAAICLLITCIACQNWFDVTTWGMGLLIASIIIMVYGIIAIIVTLLTGANVVYLIYSCLVTLLFCMYLMYDTQQILGGRRISLSPEEYILGAVTLYVDIMLVFQNMLYILNYIFGGSR